MATTRRLLPAAMGFVLCLLWVGKQPFATTIELSATKVYYFCQGSDDPGKVIVYARMSFNLGSTAVRFKVQANPELTWTYLTETPLFPTFVGNTQTGIEICFEQCNMDAQAPLVRIEYMAYGTSAICSGRLFVVPHPSAETVDVINCNGVPSAAITLPLVVGGICACPSARSYPGTPHVFDCMAVLTRTSTWGAIKALYSN